MYITIGENGSVHWPCVNPACKYHPGTGLSHEGHISDPGIHLIEDFPGTVILKFPDCACGYGGLQAQVEGYSEAQLAEAHPHHGTFGNHPAHARHREVARQLRAMGKHPRKSNESASG